MPPNTPLSEITRLSKDHSDGLKRLSLHTVEDLLFYFPTRYESEGDVVPLKNINHNEDITIYGILEKVKVRRSFKGHIPMTEGYVRDNSGSVKCIWLNQAYIGKMYQEGARVKVSGKAQVENKDGSTSSVTTLMNPSINKAPLIIPSGEASLFPQVENKYLIPIYKETKGVSSLFLYSLLKRIMATTVLDDIQDTLPQTLLEKLHLPKIKEALLYIHFPKKADLTIASRKRFAFEEIFTLQVTRLQEKAKAHGELAYTITSDAKMLKDFISRFSFMPTRAQVDAYTSLLADMKRNDPMGRLLEGDVGSGKTFVAAVIAHAVIQHKKNGTPLQVAYMAPTEILAKQHFESFISFFDNMSIEIGLLTGSGCKKFPSKVDKDGYTNISRPQLLKWTQEGRVSIVVGTHALIQKSVIWKDLALVIIDEQHRFGVKQRKMLAHKKGDGRHEIPHLLSMTATPIPRTLALTLFGDLDLTVIDSQPQERKKIITEVFSSKERVRIEKHMQEELKKGRQIYVICPRIDEQDEEQKQKRQLKSVKEEKERLGAGAFASSRIEVLHSKMKPIEKEQVMERMLAHDIDILVATSVVEVGVNVPNASLIVIEGADRFGLAQLHQLRGRVGRSVYQSYCYLYTDSEQEKTMKRLKALVEAKNGFELAELDMMERGIGTLADGKQWGISDIAMEALKNPKLVEIARDEAKKIIDEDMTLASHPHLRAKIEEREKVHME